MVERAWAQSVARHLGELSRVVVLVMDPDGRVRQLETSLSAGDELMPVMCVQVDVTEGAEIRAREEELRVAQAVAHVGNWRLNLQTRALTWSDETYRIFGVPVGEPVNLERFFSLIHPDDLPTIQAAWQAALDGAPYDVEHRIVVGEEVLWVRERAELRQGPGEAPSALGTVQEITERKSHKLALAEERCRLAEVMSATGVGTWEWDLHTDVLTVSRQWLQMLGYAPGELEPITVATTTRLTHPDDLPQVEDNFRRQLEGEVEILEQEFRMRRRDRTWIWVHLRSAVVERDPQGMPRRMSGTQMDITERKRAERALMESRAILQRIVETIPMRIFWKDTQLRYMGCNTAFARDGGLEDPAQLIGKDDYTMTWSDQAELYRADDRAVMEGGNNKLNFEEPQTTPDGHTIWLRTSKVPLTNDKKEVIGILGMYDDVTEARNLAEALKQREQYQRALLDNFPFMVWLKDAQSRFLAVNRAMVEAVGKTSVDEINGRTDLDIWPKDLAEAYRTDDWAVLQSGIPKTVQERVEVEGRRRWFETYKSPVAIDGRVVGTVGFARDITESRQREEADRFQREGTELEARVAQAIQAASMSFPERVNRALACFEGMVGLPDGKVASLTWALDRADAEPVCGSGACRVCISPEAGPEVLRIARCLEP
ncbi:MAG: PAS domain S-box protein, partial [Myxococcales bacterium]|nr:PAS domain S-box protein [Myxococcales bacterium]